MGPLRRLTRRRLEPPAEVNPRLQAHPMPVGPSTAPTTDTAGEADARGETSSRRESVSVIAQQEPSGGTPMAGPTDEADPTIATSAADPGPPPTHEWTAEEQPYDRLDCPACGTIFRELPEATAGCPACGTVIHVLQCPEGVRHLLTASDADAFNGDWDALHARRKREESLRRNALALRARRATLASYVELGVRLVELRTAPGVCAACLAAAARPYRPRVAPDLPIAGCQHEICRCLYAPATPHAPHH